MGCLVHRKVTTSIMWRLGGAVFSASDFQLDGRWFEPGPCRRVVFLDKKLCSTLSLSTQVWKGRDYHETTLHVPESRLISVAQF